VTKLLNIIKIKYPARVSNYDATTKMLLTANSTAIHNNTTTVLRPFVWDYPGEQVPEETLTHPPS